jgi:hypothetical protein
MSYTKQQKQQKLIAATLAVLACLVMGSFGWHTASAAASNAGTLGTKVVNMREIQRVWDAVRITAVTIGTQRIQTGLSGARGEIKPGTPFQADEDWLKNMTISLTNRTDKPVVCAQLRIWFPDTGDGTATRPMTSYVITVGQRPESSLYYKDGSKISADTTKKALLLAPGETLAIQIAPEIEAIQSTIEGVGNTLFSKVTRVEIEPTNFYFSDGMRWDAVNTGYYTPDAEHPGKYIKLDETYFPGSPARTRALQ